MQRKKCMESAVNTMIIHESSEDYLEAMLMLREEKGYIRSVDVAEKLGVKKPSVSYATKRLREAGYITMDETGLISLTEIGYEIAQRIFTRHTMLTRFLLRIGVPEEIAREDACKLEHDLSEESFAAICRHVGGQKQSADQSK